MQYALRVIAGRAPGHMPEGPALTSVDVPGLRIEVGKDVTESAGPDGVRVLRAGKPAPGGASFIEVTTRRDGSCEIRADAFGRRELYIQTGADYTVLATSLDLLPVARSGARFDQMALAHALTVYGGRPPKRHTLYEGVRRLGVGQTARIADGRVELEDAEFVPPATRDFGERELNQYADLMLDTIRRYGNPSGNVVYLSSGWDSTCILACLVHVFGKGSVRAVIGRMRYSMRSGVINQFEIDRARAMCEYFGVPLDFVEFDYASDGAALFEPWQALFRSHQLASITALNHGRLADGAARLAGEGAPVFAGEISDGAHNLGFSQYVTIFHPVLAFREYSDKMASYLFGPTFLGLLENGQHEQDAVYQLLRGRQGSAVFDPVAGSGAVVLQQLSSIFLRGGRFPLLSIRNSRLLTRSGQDAYVAEMEAAYLAPAARACTPETLYGWYLHLYNSFHWQGSTVAPLALTAEARGLNPVLPFWDARLQELLSAMPEDCGRGLDLRHTKYPLKWMLQHRVDYPMHLQTGPHSYLYDVDPGFSHSAELVHASGFTPHFRRLLKAGTYRDVLSPEVFDFGYIDAMVARYLNQEEARGAELTDLLSLSALSMTGLYGAGDEAVHG